MSVFDTSGMDEDEFLHRRLCPDGACVGLLDIHGMCKECGLVDGEATTDPRLRGLKEDPSTPIPDPEEADEPAAHLAPDLGPPDFDNRRLCPDGACIGVVGVDGVCGTCGNVA